MPRLVVMPKLEMKDINIKKDDLKVDTSFDDVVTIRHNGEQSNCGGVSRKFTRTCSRSAMDSLAVEEAAKAWLLLGIAAG